jgi:HD-like signal output (HDOD) protein
MIEARVLFVDDDPNVLSSLRRTLHPMRNEWTMRFANGGAEAMEMLSEEKFDVVVSDMRMPEINGAQLLARVKTRYPELARVILSGHSERELAIQTVNVAHQFINKPCELEELTSVIRKTVALRRLLARKEICELANGVVRMPSLPRHYLAITKELNSEYPSVDTVVQIVEDDPAMTITVLRLVNSGFFGLGSRINSVTEAIGLLGLDLLRSLALATGIFGECEDTQTFSVEQFALRGVRVGSLARQMATNASADKHTREEVFVSGMLCDIGLLMLNTTIPDKYATVRAQAAQTGEPLEKIEKQILGATHAELGAYLMGLWGFEDDIVEAIAFHHHPADAPKSVHLKPLALVHIADSLIAPNSCNPEPVISDTAYLTSLGLADHLSMWQKLAESLNSTGHDAANSMG